MGSFVIGSRHLGIQEKNPGFKLESKGCKVVFLKLGLLYFRE
jgi:hypothetical protein